MVCTLAQVTPVRRPTVTAIDWVLPLLLVQSVVRQLRGKHLSTFSLLWPIGLVVWAAVTYVRGFPPRTADLALVVGCAVTGVLLGALAGYYSSVYRAPEGRLMVKSTAATIVFWTLGAVGRLVFALYATSGGGPTIARFSAANGLTLGAWTSALTLMALAEVGGRTAVLASRALTAPPNSTTVEPSTE
ncbi:MAG: DUF1453 domain-containing protein [Acidimicrobiales bacterium]